MGLCTQGQASLLSFTSMHRMEKILLAFIMAFVALSQTWLDSIFVVFLQVTSDFWPLHSVRERKDTFDHSFPYRRKTIKRGEPSVTFIEQGLKPLSGQIKQFTTSALSADMRLYLSD